MGAFDNPIPSFELWPSFESDLVSVNTADVEERSKDSRQDDGPIDLDEFDKHPHIDSHDSESTLKLANVNDRDYCQLDDLSVARNLTDSTMSTSRLSFCKSIDTPLIEQRKPQPAAAAQKKKSTNIFSSLFTRKKHQKKRSENSVPPIPPQTKDKRDSPPNSISHMSGLIIDLDTGETCSGWKQRNCE